MQNKHIVIATDFSTRSDRAARRASLLAKDLGAKLSLVHVIDDDQPRRIVQAENTAAMAILNEQARTLRDTDGLDCEALTVEGDPFQAITQAAEDLDADLVVIGPHRRQALKDVFVGTTAERTIRTSRRPILMANAVPAGSYRRALVAVDLSEGSARALQAVQNLGIDEIAAVSVIHVFDAFGASLMKRGSVREESMSDYVEEERQRASEALTRFLDNTGFKPIGRFLAHSHSTTANEISVVVGESSSDLLVIGTNNRKGIAKFLMGSVAQEVLRTANVDVLAITPDMKS